MPEKSDKSLYYYASGEKIPLLTAAGVVSVHSDEIDAKLTSAANVDEIKSASRQLRGGVSIIDQHDVSDSAAQVLQDHEVGRAVFEIEGGYMVPMPEVRVEDMDDTKLSQVSNWVKNHFDLAQVVAESSGRIVIKPVSGDPLDALEIANRITEEVKPEMSQIRFIRLVNRPDITKIENKAAE